jgi:hypothetical protein
MSETWELTAKIFIITTQTATAQVPTGTYSHRADELCGGRARTRAEMLF